MLAKLEETIEEFADLDPRERLEMLLEFSEQIPDLPERFEQERLQGLNRVHECQTPVFLWVEVVDNEVHLYGWVAPEAPTVKGFVSLLIEACHKCSPSEIEALDGRLVQRLGLVDALGMVRMRGLNGVVLRIRRAVEKAAGRD